MSKPENIAPSVPRMLFYSIVYLVRLAVLVARSPGVLIRLPKDMMQALLGSFYGGLQSITIRAYVTTLSSGLQSISWFLLYLVSPWAILSNSLPISVCNSSPVVGLSLFLWYCVVVSLLIRCTTPLVIIPSQCRSYWLGWLS